MFCLSMTSLLNSSNKPHSKGVYLFKFTITVYLSSVLVLVLVVMSGMVHHSFEMLMALRLHRLRNLT
jgi:hypothetical protein